MDRWPASGASIHGNATRHGLWQIQLQDWGQSEVDCWKGAISVVPYRLRSVPNECFSEKIVVFWALTFCLRTEHCSTASHLISLLTRSLGWAFLELISACRSVTNLPKTESLSLVSRSPIGCGLCSIPLTRSRSLWQVNVKNRIGIVSNIDKGLALSISKDVGRQ